LVRGDYVLIKGKKFNTPSPLKGDGETQEVEMKLKELTKAIKCQRAYLKNQLNLLRLTNEINILETEVNILELECQKIEHQIIKKELEENSGR